MTMDELSVMDGMKCILQLRGVRPFLSNKYNIKKRKNYQYLSDYDPKNAFVIGKFVSTTLKIKDDEPYEFYEFESADIEQADDIFNDFPVDLEPI
jgi:type IV secretion system protein VirD4